MIEIFEKLASDNSRNFKLEVLKENKDNLLLREVIYLALNPLLNFYIRKIPQYESKEVTYTLEEAIELLHDLSSRRKTGNAAIDHLAHILSSVSEGDAEVIKKIIKKDLKCGVSHSTANAVWKGLIPRYPCMLCSGYSEKLANGIAYPAIVQKKEDGMRFNAIVKNGSIDFRSRNGREIIVDEALANEFIALADGRSLVFDGEFLVKRDGEILDRQTGNGILNKSIKGTISEAEAATIHATLWDMIQYEDFENGKSLIPYIERWTELDKTHTRVNTSRIHLVESKEVDSLEEAWKMFMIYYEHGFEGIILKDSKSIWEDKRSKQQVKFKGEEECDLFITGLQNGTGKYDGMLGAIECQSADGKLNVVVGSGFNDDQRKSLNEDIIGKVVAVKYNAKITNKQGENSLFLPIFVEIREDKDKADSFKDIK